jgi:phthalate 4,5-dioxygenase
MEAESFAMMTAEQNERITKVSAGTPAGALLRRYWQPVALVDELDDERPVKPVRVLGQDLVLFRDEVGQYGLLDRNCPHRGADLAFGRRESGGLRCLFHGWLFDVNGQCLETPAVPDGKFCRKMRQKAYPVLVRSGIVFGFLGEGAPPALPRFDCFIAPDQYTFSFKGLVECNWLQVLEVGIDPAHASFLHRFEKDEEPAAAYGKQFRAESADSTMPLTKLMRESFCPDIKVEPVPYGLRLIALRQLDEQRTHVRVTNLIFPQAFVIPMSTEMTISQWHVPIDDVNTYWYAIFTSFGDPVDKATMRAQRLQLYELPDYRSRRNRTNNYGFDPREQASVTYTGMGHDINVHDNWAVESQGRIQNRTREHLASSDRAIAAYRRMLLDAIRKNETGEVLPLQVSDGAAAAMTGPASVDGIGPTSGWAEYWRQLDASRRRASAWASALA